MPKDYYWEYIQQLDSLIHQFSEEVLRQNPLVFHLGPYNFEKGIHNTIWQTLLPGRITYNKLRKKDVPVDEALETIRAYMYPLLFPSESSDTSLFSPSDLPAESLTTYRNLRHRIVFYCKNYRLFQYLLPLLNSIQEPIIILSENSLPDQVKTGKQTAFITLDDFQLTPHIQNNYIKEKFPSLYNYANSLVTLTEILAPRAFFLIEGPHFESALIGEIGKCKNIPVICLQQGWPAIMHTAFRDINYNYYLTWGKKFNTLWKKFNPIPRFKEVGYLYDIEPSGPKEYITFFLQAPVILLDEVSFQDCLYLIELLADEYPEQKIYIREHPEYLLPDYYHAYFTRYDNIFWGTTLPLTQIYARTKIGISVFSSTLMEGLIHDIIPLVFNPTSMPGYYPDIEKEGLGLYAKTFQEAIEKTGLMINNEQEYQDRIHHIRQNKSHFFTAHSSQTRTNILQFLEQIHVIGS